MCSKKIICEDADVKKDGKAYYSITSKENDLIQKTVLEGITDLESFVAIAGMDASRIFACFPGGIEKLQEAIKDRLAIKSLSNCNPGKKIATSLLAVVDDIIKNGNLEIGILKQWRNNLQKLPGFETNPVLIQTIGMLTLGSGQIKHLAYEIDGNRRWAVQHGMSSKLGHNTAFTKTVPDIVTEIFNYKLHTLTLACATKKNLFRDKEEVKNFLLQIYNSLDFYLKLAAQMRIRIFRIGSTICLSKDVDIINIFDTLLKKFNHIEESTKQYRKCHLILAVNYDSEDDIERSIKKLYASYGKEYNITYTGIVKHSDLGQQPYPYPDLLIRPIFPSNGLRAGDFLRLTTANTCMVPGVVSPPELTMNEIFRAAAIFAHPLIQYRSADHIYKDDGAFDEAAAAISVMSVVRDANTNVSMDCGYTNLDLSSIKANIFVFDIGHVLLDCDFKEVLDQVLPMGE